MKVRNLRRIIFMKGIELERDLQSGEVGTVLREFERSERILQAIQSGALEEVGGVNKRVGSSVVHTPVEDEDGFRALIGTPAVSPIEVPGARARKMVVEKAPPNPNETQLEKFARLNGKAKTKFVKEMDLASVRTALATMKKGKTRDALEARFVELMPKTVSQDAIPTEEKVENPNRPESI